MYIIQDEVYVYYYLNIISVFLTFRVPFFCSIEFFKEAGEVVDVRLNYFDDGNFKGFGHVEFASEEIAKKVSGRQTIIHVHTCFLKESHVNKMVVLIIYYVTFT